tara:strand:- start:142 stop:327 length:186 start_codon:yes stop_codon:yes gene_type:complete
MENIKLTSVKVDIKQQHNFKKVCLENGMNFQKLVNRALYLYNTDEKFKKKINEIEILSKNF